MNDLVHISLDVLAGVLALIRIDDMVNNLVAEVFGILVTVGLIEWILRQRDKKRWSSPTDFMFFSVVPHNQKADGQIGDTH